MTSRSQKRFRSESLTTPAVVFLVSRISLFFLSFMALSTIGLSHDYDYYSAFPAYISINKFLEGFTRWDGAWYVEIAQKGYNYAPGGMSSIAFFPAYPLLIRVLLPILNPYLAGVIVSNSAFLAGLVLLFSLIKEKVGEKIAFRTILLVSFFPFSFFFSAVYTEALFFLAAAAAFWLMEKSKWLEAGMAIALASLVRTQGVFLIPILALNLFLKGEFRPKRTKLTGPLAVFVSLIGILAFVGFNQVSFGEPLAFINAHIQGWYRAFDPSFAEHRRALAVAIGLKSADFGVFDLLRSFNLVLAIFWLALLPKIKRVLGPAYALFTLLMVGLPLINSLWSLERSVLLAFPGFVALASLKERFFLFSLILSALFLSFWASLFFTGHPVQ